MRIAHCSPQPAAKWREMLGLLDVRGHALVLERARSGGLVADVISHWQAWRSMRPDELVHSIVIYTDGAARLTQGWPRQVACAGWGAIILARSPAAPGQLLWLGALCSGVVCDMAMSGFLGATRPSAPVAELTAITVIFNLMIKRLEAPPPVVAVRADSVFALDMVALRARAHANHALVGHARAIAISMRKTSRIILEHVSAHKGEPGNELADILADIGMCGLSFTP